MQSDSSAGPAPHSRVLPSCRPAGLTSSVGLRWVTCFSGALSLLRYKCKAGGEETEDETMPSGLVHGIAWCCGGVVLLNPHHVLEYVGSEFFSGFLSYFFALLLGKYRNFPLLPFASKGSKPSVSKGRKRKKPSGAQIITVGESKEGGCEPHGHSAGNGAALLQEPPAPFLGSWCGHLAVRLGHRGRAWITRTDVCHLALLRAHATTAGALHQAWVSPLCNGDHRAIGWVGWDLTAPSHNPCHWCPPPAHINARVLPPLEESIHGETM